MCRGKIPEEMKGAVEEAQKGLGKIDVIYIELSENISGQNDFVVQYTSSNRSQARMYGRDNCFKIISQIKSRYIS